MNKFKLEYKSWNFEFKKSFIDKIELFERERIQIDKMHNEELNRVWRNKRKYDNKEDLILI
jgi:hypothetical protein